MPRLPNPKHELLARNLVKTKFNQTKAHSLTYPDSNYHSSRVNASVLIANHNIEERAIEILNQNKSTSATGVLTSFEEDLQAERAIPTDKPIVYVRDNATILETKKTLLRIHGILDKDKSSITYNDNRSITAANLDAGAMEKLVNSIQDLRQSADRARARRTASVEE